MMDIISDIARSEIHIPLRHGMVSAANKLVAHENHNC